VYQECTGLGKKVLRASQSFSYKNRSSLSPFKYDAKFEWGWSGHTERLNDRHRNDFIVLKNPTY